MTEKAAPGEIPAANRRTAGAGAGSSMGIEFIANGQPVRRAPEPLVDPVNKIILFWMHRCGSTTGQLWFFEAAGWKERMKGKGASQLAPEWYEEHAGIYTDLAPFYRDPSFLKIAVVRHPLSRAVSAYSVVTDTKSGSQWRAVSRSIKDPDADTRITFNEFVTFLESVDLATANYHWRLQTASDWYDLKLPGVEFVRVELIQADLDRMCAKLGKRPIVMKKSSATTKVESDLRNVDLANLRRTDYDRIFGKDKRGIIQFPDYRHFMTPDVTARLAKLYARDLEVLDYKAEATA